MLRASQSFREASALAALDGRKADSSGFLPESVGLRAFLSVAVLVNWLHIVAYWAYAAGNPPWVELVHLGE
jgi:hypothetical protein